METGLLCNTYTGRSNTHFVVWLSAGEQNESSAGGRRMTLLTSAVLFFSQTDADAPETRHIQWEKSEIVHSDGHNNHATCDTHVFSIRSNYLPGYHVSVGVRQRWLINMSNYINVKATRAVLMFLTGQLRSLIEWTHSALKDKKGGRKKNSKHIIGHPERRLVT